MRTLKIKDIINNDIAVSTDMGEKVYELINGFLEKNENVVLDFSEIQIMTTAFLNVAIGKLYGNENYNSEFLNKNIEIINVAKEDMLLFKKVVERAKEYFKVKANIENSAKDILIDD